MTNTIKTLAPVIPASILSRKWSNYQEAFFEFVLNPVNGSCVTNAVAGSGKTTTSLACAIMALSTFPVVNRTDFKTGETIRQSEILFLAFNKSIVKELAEKLLNDYNLRDKKDGIDVKTLHSQGMSALTKMYKKLYGCYPAKDWVDEKKWDTIITEQAIGLSSRALDDAGMSNAFVGNCIDLFNKCRVELVRGGQFDRIEGVAEHYGIDLYADEVNVVSNLLYTAYEVTPENLRSIDYTDMVCIPAVNRNHKLWRYYTPKYQLVFVDECQDLNNAQRELLLGSISENGRFVAVGDRRQAINGFAGASCDSFDLLKGLAGGHELGLSVCYRCGKAMIELAKGIVPQIEAFEGAGEGEIRHSNELDLKAGDMVLCRKSAPLVGLCLKLIAHGIGAKVKGRDIADGLVALINKCKVKDIDRLFIALDKEVEKLVKKLQTANVEDIENNPRLIALQDKVDCIKVLAENAKNANDIVDNLERLFSDDMENKNQFVILSTIHKAKGLEADNVAILLPNKLPLVYKGQKPWEYEQEKNLEYVAYTRAKKVLTFIDLDEDGLNKYKF